MKKLAILGSILLTVSSFAQDFVASLPAQHQILYRGYDNTVVFNQVGSDKKEFTIKSVNCNATKAETSEYTNTYIVKVTAKEKSAKIFFLVDKDIVDSIEFKVAPLPPADLFWGYEKGRGSNISNSSILRMGYDSDISLKSTFKILSWECTIDGKKFSGDGNKLSSEFLEHTNTLPVGNNIIITVRWTNGNGVVRATAGSWVKQ